jgi:F-type H+-transporting ATPase subunit b
MSVFTSVADLAFDHDKVNDSWWIVRFDMQLIIQLTVQLMATLLIVYFMVKLLYKPVNDMLEKRKERIIKESSDTLAALEHAEKSKEEYALRLHEVENERNQILERAQKRAAEQEEQILTHARNEAEVIINRAKQEIEREKEKIKDEVKKQIIEIASSMASNFVTSTIDAAAQTKLFNDAIADLGDAEWLS